MDYLFEIRRVTCILLIWIRLMKFQKWSFLVKLDLVSSYGIINNLQFRIVENKKNLAAT